MAMAMAGTSCRSPLLPLSSLALKSVPSLQTKPLSKIFMLKPAKLSVNNRILTFQITSSTNNNQVFEDRSNGVICYRDDDGEIICEGYDDEEPRVHREIEKVPCESYRSKFGAEKPLTAVLEVEVEEETSDSERIASLCSDGVGRNQSSVKMEVADQVEERRGKKGNWLV